MAAARDRTRSIAAVVRAHRHAAPLGLACGALIAGVMLLGNPFAASPFPPPRAAQEIRLGTAELSLPESAPAPVAATPKPAPGPTRQASAPVFVVPPAAAPAPPPRPAPATRQTRGGKRAAIIVETLPAKPIIPPFMPREATGATPEPHSTLPLDTEIGKTSTIAPTAAPEPKTAAASLSRDG